MFIQASKEIPLRMIIEMHLRSLTDYYGIESVLCAYVSRSDYALLNVAIDNILLTYPDHADNVIREFYKLKKKRKVS